MKLGQIQKFFYDNNIIIRQNNDTDRLKYLTFLAAVYLESNDIAQIKDREIIMDVAMKDYSFDEVTTTLLHSINYAYGFSFEIMHDSGFQNLFKEQESVQCQYCGLRETFSYSKRIAESMKVEYYKKVPYYNGYNTFFLDPDLELNDSLKEKLDKIHDQKQCTFFVTTFHEQYVIW
ncbi:MAG: hypothetical protein IJ193_02390 [Bacilli bacterium]|nr:hypothetical protein [Bacilli bacterium]